MRFCLEDGTPLGVMSSHDPEATLVFHAEPKECNKEGTPTDNAVILSQLTKLEYDLYEATRSVNLALLEQILADEYVGVGEVGIAEPKTLYLNRLKTAPRPSNVTFGIGDLQLTVRGNTATLNGTLTETTSFRIRRSRFADDFVWRDGRWQATGSQVSLISNRIKL